MTRLHRWLWVAFASLLVGCQGVPHAPTVRHMDVNGVRLAYVGDSASFEAALRGFLASQ